MAEVLPFVAACRFLEREAASLLAPMHLGRWGRPFWLVGTRAVVERRPFGAVLILAPGNYPLMLPGIQILQALVAGNAVAVKPAPGCEVVTDFLLDLLGRAGVPEGLVRAVPADEGPDAVRAGYDLIVLTGSARTGKAVARMAAETLTPVIMELSGSDSVFVLPGADLERVARALVFGVRLNGSATCIAPRRVFVTSADEPLLWRHLRAMLGRGQGRVMDERLVALGNMARKSGGLLEEIGGVLLIRQAGEDASYLGVDIFAPWLALIAVPTMADAIRQEQACDYALGASVFGPETEARELAHRLPVGSICINDLIVPTADPRLPFGGAKSSGFGVTRGREGLLAMTRAVTVSTRRRFGGLHLPHA